MSSCSHSNASCCAAYSRRLASSLEACAAVASGPCNLWRWGAQAVHLLKCWHQGLQSNDLLPIFQGTALPGQAFHAVQFSLFDLHSKVMISVCLQYLLYPLKLLFLKIYSVLEGCDWQALPKRFHTHFNALQGLTRPTGIG